MKSEISENGQDAQTDLESTKVDSAGGLTQITAATDVDEPEVPITSAQAGQVVEGEEYDVTQLPSEQEQDAASRLRSLGATGKDQEEIEKDVAREADKMLLEQADERDQKRLDKTQAQKDRLSTQIRNLQLRLNDSSRTTMSSAARIEAEIQHLLPQIDSLDRDLDQIKTRMKERDDNGAEVDKDADQGGNVRRPGETRREFLIRTGKITPFSKMGQSVQKASDNLADVMLDAEELGDDFDEGDEDLDHAPLPLSHRNLLKPGFADDGASETDATDGTLDLTQDIDDRPRKRRKVDTDARSSPIDPASSGSGDEFEPEPEVEQTPASDEEIDDADFAVVTGGPDTHEKRFQKRKPVPRTKKKKDRIIEPDDEVEDLTGLDDGNEQIYLARLRKWTKGRKAARRKAQAKLAEQGAAAEDTAQAPAETAMEEAAEEKEWLMPHPTRSDAEFEGGLRIPGDVFPSLFDYQKTGVQWLSELYSQQVGGIVGDEMGLGKTIQVIAFLAGLHHSNRLDRPIIIVAPATVMKQWVQEFHRWWPPLRVSILHTSGSGMMDVRSEKAMEDRLEADYEGTSTTGSSSRAAQKVVNRVLREGHILVTTYSGLQSYAELLLPVEWGYAVLDEGHKIRNPNAKITIFSKSLRTPNRVILSGTPMQNNLTELWSLFDFVFPMRLGTLVSFRTQFEIPIKQGGYANASNLQVETALKCAETLKDTISPYLLQRFKVDVAADLPKKSEQVLFCRLTKLQRSAYEAFLASPDMTAILEAKRHALFGIDIMRKICNHPDLTEHKTLSVKPGYNYGSGAKSGKMQVVKALLELWRDTGHKTLLFAQHRIMLDILEKFLRTATGFNFLRMDGTTPIKDRQDMVDKFNRDPNLHVFLLTTKVGGLGVNLTGADRVIIYDPDWNPSTDMQARERSWRLGQKREVMIYRLMTAGTIEEKIYHRQIFKQFLTNKILRDPKQRQTFQLKDLHDLFSLGNEHDENTETGGLFKGTEVKFDEVAEANGDANGDSPKPGDGSPTGSSKVPNTAVEVSSEINSIVGISHREEFKDGKETAKATPQTSAPDPSSESNGSTDPTVPANNNDSRILSSIFSRSGVHSALEHDAIIAGSSRGKITADPAIIAAEAKKVAAAAARELKRAGEQAVNVPIGTPTWTGIHGIGGRPEQRNHSPAPTRGRGGFAGGRGGARGGPSSSSVLANLSARQQGNTPSSRGSTPGTSDDLVRGAEFLKMIREYFIAHGGSVYTQMLINHFNRFCRTAERTAEFTAMLREIAVLDKGAGAGRPAPVARGRTASQRTASGRGKWILKRSHGGTA